MYLLKNLAGRTLFVLVLISMLAACNPASAGQTTPTVDPNTIYTAAASTVQAQLTQNAALTPSATATEELTQTLAVPTADKTLPTRSLPGYQTQLAPVTTQSVSPLASLTPFGGLATQSGSKPPIAQRVFQWLSNDPTDGTIIEAGTRFDIIWKVKNIGTTPWTTNYVYEHFLNAKFFEKTSYKLKNEVKPGAETTIVVDAMAPSTTGRYSTWWKLKNEQGQNIGDMTLDIVVVQPGETAQPATATPTH